VDPSDGTFANSIVLRLIGEGHSPGPEGDYVSLAMRPGPLCLLQLHTPGTAHSGVWITGGGLREWMSGWQEAGDPPKPNDRSLTASVMP
jgi:hypothetical protein